MITNPAIAAGQQGVADKGIVCTILHIADHDSGSFVNFCFSLLFLVMQVGFRPPSHQENIGNFIALDGLLAPALRARLRNSRVSVLALGRPCLVRCASNLSSGP